MLIVTGCLPESSIFMQFPPFPAYPLSCSYHSCLFHARHRSFVVPVPSFPITPPSIYPVFYDLHSSVSAGVKCWSCTATDALRRTHLSFVDPSPERARAAYNFPVVIPGMCGVSRPCGVFSLLLVLVRLCFRTGIHFLSPRFSSF